MRSRLIQFILILTFFLLIFLSPTLPTLGQTPTSSPRDILIEAIKKRAQRDVETNKEPEDIQGLNLLFGNEAIAVGLTLREVTEVYETEYDRLKAATTPSLWEQFKPNTGWVAAAFLFILVIFRDILKETITGLIKSIKDQVYNKLAGHRFFRRTAQRRYRQALIGKYQQLKIPFRPDRPLNIREIYVPLKIKGSNDTEQFDAYQVIAKYRRLVVIGSPGSGKSMLLRHVALTYAEARLVGLPEQPIPVLLELNRFNESGSSLKEHLIAELARNNFPHADHFIDYSLTQGTLMLLLDGLDEVNSNERKRVVRWIKNLLDEYKHCRVIITCRNAVYKSEFADIVDRTLEIVEFNDQQIRRFLGPWAPYMPPEKSIEQLMQTLHDRPRIMALARNPLLLTIIAYLYTDTPYVLPHSRAEFYQQSTDVLLRQWHQEHNQFEARDKRLILQHLALFNQDNATQHHQDRHSMDYQVVLAQIREVLPSLNLKPDQDRAILNEMVERSGLLLAIDGGAQYQFAHLTLQEFFAAAALIDNANGLVARFKSDIDTWRETVKLWCGLASDSTKFIWYVYKADPITGFECLADAQKMNPKLLDEFLSAFKVVLSTPHSMNETIIRAFATVASDLRPRSITVFKALEEMLVKATKPEQCTAAATALSLTNLPKAAEVLATYYLEKPEVRPALVRMGDLAVPMLAALAQKRVIEALDDLQIIGTPKAAEVLVPLIWAKDKTLANQVAWRLASLLPLPNVEAVLRDYQLSEIERKADLLDWVWKPFNEPANSAIPIIAGRIAYLIEQAPLETASKMSSTFDPRLVIPLCSISLRSEIKPSNVETEKAPQSFIHVLNTLDLSTSVFVNRLPTQMDTEIFGTPFEPKKVDERINILKAAADKLMRRRFVGLQAQFVDGILDMAQASHKWRYLANSLTKAMQFNLVYRMINSRQSTPNDWCNIFRPTQYTFKTSWHYRIILMLIATISIIAIAQMIIMFLTSSVLLSWGNGVLLGAIILIIVNWILFWKAGNFDPAILTIYLIGTLLLIVAPLIILIVPPLIFFSSEKNRFFINVSIFWLIMFVLSMISGSALIISYFATVFLLNMLPWQLVTLLWLTLFGVGIILQRIGQRREREAQNPLHGILDPHGRRKILTHYTDWSWFDLTKWQQLILGK